MKYPRAFAWTNRLYIRSNCSAGWVRNGQQPLIISNMRIELRKNGFPITTLCGTVADQAALHGLLQQVRDLALVLFLVEWLPEPPYNNPRLYSLSG